jgi:hypothetical protein
MIQTPGNDFGFGACDNTQDLADWTTHLVQQIEFQSARLPLRNLRPQPDPHYAYEMMGYNDNRNGRGYRGEQIPGWAMGSYVEGWKRWSRRKQ